MLLTTVGFSEYYRSRYTEENIWLIYWTSLLDLFLELQANFWNIQMQPGNRIFRRSRCLEINNVLCSANHVDHLAKQWFKWICGCPRFLHRTQPSHFRLGPVWQIKNISTTTMPMATKLTRVATYREGLPFAKLHDSLIPCEITWKVKNVIYSLSQCLKPLDVVIWWLRVRSHSLL